MKIGLYYHPAGSSLSFFTKHIPVRWRQGVRSLGPWAWMTYDIVRILTGRVEVGVQWRMGNLWIGYHRMTTACGKHTWICLVPCLVLHLHVNHPSRPTLWFVHPRTQRRVPGIFLGRRLVWPPPIPNR